MKQFSESIEIAVHPQRVWQALTNPKEVVCWDLGGIEALDAPADYPSAGQHVRWRYRLGPLPLVLHDRPTRVEIESILASSIRLGPFDFEETYQLRRTALLGPLIERIAGQPLARATVRTSLAAIKRHCEADGV